MLELNVNMRLNDLSKSAYLWSAYSRPPKSYLCSAPVAKNKLVKVGFCQKILMFLSQLQTDEHFSFLKLKIWILETENFLEIEDVLKFESLEACKVKNTAFGWLGQMDRIFVSFSEYLNLTTIVFLWNSRIYMLFNGSENEFLKKQNSNKKNRAQHTVFPRIVSALE